jgi:uncharacterized protein
MARPAQIDTRELTRNALTLEGSVEVADMERFASLLASDDGRLGWRLRGERRRRADGGDDLMHLSLHGEVTMQCVRCLGDAQVQLQAERSFRLVASEEQAAREDIEDMEFDVLVGGSHFDLAELLEDEAIMALPAFARHEQCALPASEGGAESAAAARGDRPGVDGDEDAAGDRIRPFANLAELTRRSR